MEEDHEKAWGHPEVACEGRPRHRWRWGRLAGGWKSAIVRLEEDHEEALGHPEVACEGRPCHRWRSGRLAGGFGVAASGRGIATWSQTEDAQTCNAAAAQR